MSKNLSLTIAATVIILGSSLPAMACVPYEGLSPGFWKNHLEAWPLSPNISFTWVFGEPYNENEPRATLMDALNARGGGANALARQAVAALLNSCHPDIYYPLSWRQIFDAVNPVLRSGNACAIESVKNELDYYNNLGVL